MEITKQEWDGWRTQRVTLEFFKLFRERQAAYEKKIPELIASGDPDAIDHVKIAAGRHQELEDLLNTTFDDMKEAR